MLSVLRISMHRSNQGYLCILYEYCFFITAGLLLSLQSTNGLLAVQMSQSRVHLRILEAALAVDSLVRAFGVLHTRIFGVHPYLATVCYHLRMLIESYTRIVYAFDVSKEIVCFRGQNKRTIFVLRLFCCRKKESDYLWRETTLKDDNDDKAKEEEDYKPQRKHNKNRAN